MTRFILRYRQPGPIPESALDLVQAEVGDGVINTSPRMVLVECNQAMIDSLAASLPEWSVTPEIRIPPPGKRLSILEPEGK